MDKNKIILEMLLQKLENNDEIINQTIERSHKIKNDGKETMKQEEIIAGDLNITYHNVNNNNLDPQLKDFIGDKNVLMSKNLQWINNITIKLTIKDTLIINTTINYNIFSNNTGIGGFLIRNNNINEINLAYLIIENNYVNIINLMNFYKIKEDVIKKFIVSQYNDINKSLNFLNLQIIYKIKFQDTDYLFSYLEKINDQNYKFFYKKK